MWCVKDSLKDVLCQYLIANNRNLLNISIELNCTTIRNVIDLTHQNIKNFRTDENEKTALLMIVMRTAILISNYTFLMIATVISSVRGEFLIKFL